MILAGMSVFKKITESGITHGGSTRKKRAIVLSNYIALILSISCYLIFIIIPQNHNWGGFTEMTIGAVIFSFAILLNHFSFTNISRLYLCWLPPILLMWYTTIGMRYAINISVSSYDGLRFYLLAFGCIPYILMDRDNALLFVAGILPGLACTVFCDLILDLTGVGYNVKGIVDAGYALTPIRAFISYLIISVSSLSLNFIIAKGDQLNQNLLDELAEKNRVIREQAETEVLQLNDQLKLNLQQLSEREFILNQSQRIAKIGSWEYRIENDFLFWSDQMYDIFGLDKNFNIRTGKLDEALGKEGSERLTKATVHLLKTGNLFDITIRTKTPIGYNKWFRIYAFPILEQNNIVGVRGICHDITFFKEAEEKLRTGEAKFSKVFDNYPDLIMVVREFDLMVFDVNPKIVDVLGFEKQEVIGRSSLAMDLFLNEEERKSFIKSYLVEGYSQYECRWKRKDGRIIEVKITGIRMSIDEHFYRMSVVQDITEQKAAEEKFIKAFDLSPDLMLIFRESDMVLKETNEKIFDITGFKREEVIGVNFEEKGFTIWKNIEERRLFFEKYQSNKIVYMEAQLKRKDGKESYAIVSAQQIILSNENHLIVVIHDITERKQVEKEKEYAHYQLNLRIKELTTLYKTRQILHDEQKSVPQMLSDIVSILPLGWQHPEIAGARIVVDGKEYVSANYTITKDKQYTEFQIQPGKNGSIEVIYTEERPIESEGPFLAEERNLLNMIAEMLGEYLSLKHEEELLANAQANLKATINNTEVLIWSVDRQFQLITFNIPFFEYVKNHYGIEPKIGRRVFDPLDDDETQKIKSRWKENYTRALAGEIVTLEETRFGFDFQYSLSPIIEDNMVTGVSIFADNVTERKTQDRELAEANKKIGELKLMALRSVMSPHFIFNVLNSIQFFIAKNDRLNAITYLSTFSKLIRSILTHSVNNKIRLVDEIDMLKNYVQLEMVRFENKFNFTLEVDPDVDVEEIEIPSLLIQPYVENAILHGLYNKVGTGTLKINIYEENDTVIFQIEDDGIGREAAMKLREQNFPAHKSMGIKVTEERLQLINQKHNVVFEVHDLINNSEPCGTRVRIGVIY